MQLRVHFHLYATLFSGSGLRLLWVEDKVVGENFIFVSSRAGWYKKSLYFDSNALACIHSDIY